VSYGDAVPSAAVTVLGGGVAGLAAALLLARDGHRVTLVERDPLPRGAPEDAPAWPRKGIPHFLQPHAFIPRGRSELRAHFTDVYESLLAAGAEDVDLRRKLPGRAGPGDQDLQYLAARRPLLEWALRRAVGGEAGITVREGAQVRGLTVEGGRVRAVEVGGGTLTTDVVVDALGRRTPTPRWLADAGVTTETDSSDCGVVYYSRYYRCRPGFTLPDGPFILSPRGDLGYFGYATFPGDNGTFATVLAVPPGVPEWRRLHEKDAYEAAVARISALAAWADPAGVDAITDVLPMAGLRNTLRRWQPTAPGGLLPAGDAYAHTDPVLAHGLAFALIHAVELAAALRAHADPTDRSAAYAAATGPALQERYDFATALDAERLRMWRGGLVDLASAHGDYALFSQIAAGAAALRDPDVFRVYVRRIGLLDSTAVLDGDTGLHRRIEQLFTQSATAPKPPGWPSRQEMAAAVGGSEG
jgi:2-polyprenyl-6-methoxyphenol hydroxylase-like FAD-dependent oxidoreductase